MSKLHSPNKIYHTTNTLLLTTKRRFNDQVVQTLLSLNQTDTVKGYNSGYVTRFATTKDDDLVLLEVQVLRLSKKFQNMKENKLKN